MIECSNVCILTAFGHTMRSLRKCDFFLLYRLSHPMSPLVTERAGAHQWHHKWISSQRPNSVGKIAKKNRRLKLMSISSKQKRRSNGIMHSFVPTHSLCDPITKKIYQDNETIEWNREVYTYCDGRKKETFHRFRWGFHCISQSQFGPFAIIVVWFHEHLVSI